MTFGGLPDAKTWPRLHLECRRLLTSSPPDIACMDGSDGHDSRTHGAPPPEDCTICLQPITERAVAVPCNHLSFDFVCLLSWLQQRESCPLCNAVVTEVQFDWRSPSDYRSFKLEKDQHRQVPTSSRPTGSQHQSRPRRLHADTRSIDPALERRRKIYQHGLYSHHVGANKISGYRDFTPEDFNRSPLLQRRARTFLRRELQLLSQLDLQRPVRNADFVLEYIAAMLRKFDPKGADGCAEDLLSDIMSRPNARLLLHELLAWLRSPYSTLSDWDQNVQYSSGLADQAEKNASPGTHLQRP